MGNNNTQESSSEYVHQRLGVVSLVPGPLNEENVPTTVMIKNISVNSEKQVQIWQLAVNKIKNKETLDVLFLPDKHQYKKSGFCGSSGQVTLWFEDYIFVLNNQIKNRQKIQKPFLETQIWYLLYNIIRAAKQFQRLGQKIGDVRPANIVINQDGQIKILSTLTCPEELNNFQKAIQSREQNVYLAPQQCKQQNIKTAVAPQGISPTAAQMFSIGVTLLEAMTLKNPDVLYTRNPYGFKLLVLDQIKNELEKTYYSQSLKQLVLKMVEINPQNRPKASSIYQSLVPYQNQILNLQQFQFHNETPYGHPQSQGYQPYPQQINRGFNPVPVGTVIRNTSPSYQQTQLNRQYVSNSRFQPQFPTQQVYQQRRY